MLNNRRAIRAGVISAFLIASACGSTPPEDNKSFDDKPVTGAEGGKGGSEAGKGGSGAVKNRGGGGPISEPSGEGGEAGQARCADCASGFCLDDGSCVDCLPSNDQCPSGQYCSDKNECLPGCKSDATSCASGVCDKDHNCKHCIDDSECTQGLICSSGECTPACSSDEEGKSASCSGGLTCCAARCSDLTVDSQNCGTCGNACAKGQFCGRTACGTTGAGGEGEVCVECHDTTLANVCSVAKVTVILDSSKNTSDGNRVPGRTVGAALRDTCPNGPILTEAEQDSVEALNITTGRPVSDSSELLVVAGGPFFQDLEGYLEKQKITPLYWASDADSTAFRKNSGKNEVVVSLPFAGDHDSHDFFIIQFMRDPSSGSLILNVQGFWLSGTVAGAYLMTQGVLPALKQQDKAWYAYEWTDQDGDKAPSLTEIKLVDSGS